MSGANAFRSLDDSCFLIPYQSGKSNRNGSSMDMLDGCNSAFSGMRTVQISLNPFTLVGATTRSGLLTAPLRARFGIQCHLEYYDSSVLQKIIQRSSRILNIDIDSQAALEIACRSRGTPRIANALLRRVRDFAQVEGNGRIDLPITKYALDALKDKDIVLMLGGFDKKLNFETFFNNIPNNVVK